MEGRGGKGRAGQGRVPDCLGGLSRVGISSRLTRPWNGQPPSIYNIYQYFNFTEMIIIIFQRFGPGTNVGIFHDVCSHFILHHVVESLRRHLGR